MGTVEARAMANEARGRLKTPAPDIDERRAFRNVESALYNLIHDNERLQAELAVLRGPDSDERDALITDPLVKAIQEQRARAERVEAERDAVVKTLDTVRAWQTGAAREPFADSPTVSYGEWARKAILHLGTILSAAPAPEPPRAANVSNSPETEILRIEISAPEPPSGARCTCGFGGFHDDVNPHCDLNIQGQRSPVVPAITEPPTEQEHKALAARRARKAVPAMTENERNKQ